MLRNIGRLACNLVLVEQTAGYQNFVTSEILRQLDKKCLRYCPAPRVPPQKVTVLGAGSDIGAIVSLFLKQQNVIKVLSLYDDDPKHAVVGKATDLAHIDTSPAVEAYQGRVYLKPALHDADVVLICGGKCIQPPCCDALDRELFFENMTYVRTMAVACTTYCPKAVILIQTPPVDCNFALVSYTFKVARVYKKRRILGVNSVNAMRANQLLASMISTDPTKSTVPVICGTGRCTRVPVFSAFKTGNVPQSQTDCLTRLVREADEIICRVKCDGDQGHLSTGFATARFVTNVMNGMFRKSTFVDSALVEQGSPEKCFKMKVCATPVMIGKNGVQQYAIPTLNAAESKLLADSKCDLEDMLNLGRCYALGEEYYVHPCKVPICPMCPPCKVCEACLPIKKK